MTRLAVVITLVVITCLVLGCQSSPGLALKASSALGELAEQQEVMLDEYHQEVVEMDDLRESRVTNDLVLALKANPDSPETVAAFLQIMRNIRADREVEWARKQNGRDNISVLRKMAAQLEQYGIDALSLDDELRRYVTGWSDKYKEVKALKDQKKQEAAALRKQQFQDAINTGLNVISQFQKENPNAGKPAQ